jgi:hypothetical protein
MKNFKPTFILIGLVFSFSQELYAQESTLFNRSSSVLISYNNSSAPKTLNIGLPVIANPDAKLRAILLSIFPDAANQQWRNLNGFYYVTFLNNDRKARAVFTLKGDMNYATTDCQLEDLPASLRMRILKSYPDFTLLNALEIKAFEALAYHAVLENASGYVTLKSAGNVIEELDVRKKAK